MESLRKPVSMLMLLAVVVWAGLVHAAAPVVENDGYTANNQYSTLTGDLQATNGALTTVRIYWGETDGGTDPAAWAHTNILSGNRAEGLFSANTTTSLTFGVQYYFCSYATNADGQAWASSTMGFVSGMPSPAPPTANLEAWYDSSVGLITNGSGTVTNWSDRSGNARDLILDAGTPTVAADEVNGLPAVNFNNDGENLVMSPGNEYFSKETWLAFRSGQANTFRGWGSPFGPEDRANDNERSWMFQSGTAQFWTTEKPEAVDHNGTSIASAGSTFTMASQGSMSDFMVLRVVTGPNSTTLTRAYGVGTRNDQWTAGRYYTAEILAYNSTNTAADQEDIGRYLSDKYGIATVYPMMVGVTNLPFSDVTSTSATFNASFKGEASLFDVRVYWGTSDGGDDPVAWAQTNYVGSFTNQTSWTNLSVSTNGLAVSTRYYYRFRAENAATNIWADPGITFETIGTPTIGLGAGVVPLPGYATLNGSVVDGGQAEITVCWGESDGGTGATSDWENAVAMGTQYTGIDFSTNTVGALYGPTYYCRVYGTNAFGEDWSSVTNFTTLREKIGADGIMHHGYHTGPNGVMNLDDNSASGMMGGGDPTQGPTYYGSALITDGPGGTGLDIDSDAEFASDGAVGQVDNYSSLFLGYFMPPETGDYGFKSQRDDDRSGIWFDLDQDGVFESLSGVLTSDDGEQLAWENTSWHTVSLTSNKRYRVAFTHSEGGGGSDCDFRFRGPGVSGEPIIKPSDAGQAGLWHYDIAPALGFSFENSEVTNVAPGSAYLNTALTAPSQLYDVRVFWHTTDYGTNKADWVANASMALLGSYTNVSGESLTYQAMGLLADSTYYYAFHASNQLEEIFAEPSASFNSFGTPTVSATGMTSIDVGLRGTLNGELTAGGVADVYVVWGSQNAGTTDTSLWQNIVVLTDVNELGAFSSMVTGLTYGITYYYACLATNASGSGWSSVDSWVIGTGIYSANGLMHHGYHTGPNGVMNLDDNSASGMMGGGDPTQGPTYYGSALITDGPGGTGLDIDSDAEFASDGAVGQVDNYSSLFLGYFMPPETGDYGFKSQRDDDRSGIWFDLDQDGVFESLSGVLTSDDGEQLAWENTSWHTVSLASGQYYRVAFTHSEGGGGSDCDFRFRGPGVSGEPIIKPSDAGQAGVWYYESELNVGVTNNGATGILAEQADLQGTLLGEHSVYDVWVYWSTSDGGTNKAAWLAEGGGHQIGSFTNVASTSLVHRITSLLAGTRYYYRFYGSNAASTVWTTPSETLKTFDPNAGAIFTFR